MGEANSVDPRELLLANLDLVERLVAFTCRRQRLDASEAEELGAVVKLKLVENDFSIIRKFEGRSSFSTFLSVVVSRLLSDHRIHNWGKWHPSAEATRLGTTAMELEQLLHRDGKTFDEAAAILGARDSSATRAALEQLAARLPVRTPKRRLVGLDQVGDVQAPADETALQSERTRTSERVSRLVRSHIDALPADDRIILQLRFDSGMTVAQIARALQLDQKTLYRRFERLLRDLRRGLESAGIAAGDATDLIESRGTILEFGLGNSAERPSKPGEGTHAARHEEMSR